MGIGSVLYPATVVNLGVGGYDRAGQSFRKQVTVKPIGTFVKVMLLSVPSALANLFILGSLERLARGNSRDYPTFFEAVIPQWDIKFWFVGLLFVLFAQSLWLVRLGVLTGSLSVGRTPGGGYDANAYIPVKPLQAYALSLIWSVVVILFFLMTRCKWDS